MNPPHVCLICMGANRDSERNLAAAVRELARLFTLRQVGQPVRTPAEDGVKGAEDYFNQAVVLETELGREETEAVFKTIERQLGRSPADKQSGSVPLDIDLLQYDSLTLRPDDWRKSYVRKALASCRL